MQAAGATGNQIFGGASAGNGLGKSKAQMVAEVLATAGEAFGKLSDMLMELQPEDELLKPTSTSGTRWTDEEVKRLHEAMAVFNNDLAKISQAVKTRSIAQVKAKLKKDGTLGSVMGNTGGNTVNFASNSTSVAVATAAQATPANSATAAANAGRLQAINAASTMAAMAAATPIADQASTAAQNTALAKPDQPVAAAAAAVTPNALPVAITSAVPSAPNTVTTLAAAAGLTGTAAVSGFPSSAANTTTSLSSAAQSVGLVPLSTASMPNAATTSIPSTSLSMNPPVSQSILNSIPPVTSVNPLSLSSALSAPTLVDSSMTPLTVPELAIASSDAMAAISEAASNTPLADVLSSAIPLLDTLQGNVSTPLAPADLGLPLDAASTLAGVLDSFPDPFKSTACQPPAEMSGPLPVLSDVSLPTSLDAASTSVPSAFMTSTALSEAVTEPPAKRPCLDADQS